jgi:tetratricopeptide (TPR) repeat protein
VKVAKILGIAVLAALVITISHALLAQEKSEDTVEIQRGNIVYRMAPVTIKRETYKVVRYGDPPTIPWQDEPTENVVSVEHGDRSQKFIDAEEDRDKGAYETAIEKYRACIKFEEKEWVKVYSSFYVAECYFLWARTDPSKFEEALKSYDNFIAQFADHRLVPAAWKGKADCANRLKKSQIAQEAYEQMAKGEFGLKYKCWGEIGLAQIDMAQGKLEQGLERIRKIFADINAQKVPGVVAACRLLLAKGLVATKKYDEAIRNLKETVSKPEGVGKEVMATAHNLLGDCYRQLGSAQDTEKALLEYLKVVLLYSEIEPEYASALPNAIALAESLGGDTYKNVIKDLKEEARKLQK